VLKVADQTPPKLDDQATPTKTHNLTASISTVHSSNLKGRLTSSIKSSNPAKFIYLPGSNPSSTLRSSRIKVMEKNMELSTVTDESLNNRVENLDNNYQDTSSFKTPKLTQKSKRRLRVAPDLTRMSYEPARLSKREENIVSDEMNDSDHLKDQKVRDYSFTPTKTPFKKSPEELERARQKKPSKRKVNISNYSVTQRHHGKFSSRSVKKGDRFTKLRKYRPVEAPLKYDINNFRMEKQPNHDGTDQKITIWCTCEEDVKKYFCKTARSWTEIVSHEFKYHKWKESYENIIKGQVQSKQISKDIERTFQKHYAFRNTSMIHRLARVLCAISLYDDKVGYVQGMNFVVGAFLIHCEESIAFWLVIELFERYEMREVYEDGLKGMYRHSGI